MDEYKSRAPGSVEGEGRLPMTEQEKFEKWMREDLPEQSMTLAAEWPCYASYVTCCIVKAWQAALSAAPTPPEVEPYAFAYENMKPSGEGWDSSIHRKRMDHYPENWQEAPLYTRSPAPKADEGEPRLVSYGLNMETCTLRLKEAEYSYDLHYRNGESTRPAPNDELRAAAEEVLKQILSVRNAGVGVLALEAALGYLRAALNKKEYE